MHHKERCSLKSYTIIDRLTEHSRNWKKIIWTILIRWKNANGIARFSRKAWKSCVFTISHDFYLSFWRYSSQIIISHSFYICFSLSLLENILNRTKTQLSRDFCNNFFFNFCNNNWAISLAFHAYAFWACLGFKAILKNIHQLIKDVLISLKQICHYVLKWNCSNYIK